jgi:hypothetical protein
VLATVGKVDSLFNSFSTLNSEIVLHDLSILLNFANFFVLIDKMEGKSCFLLYCLHSRFILSCEINTEHALAPLLILDIEVHWRNFHLQQKSFFVSCKEMEKAYHMPAGSTLLNPHLPEGLLDFDIFEGL